VLPYLSALENAIVFKGSLQMSRLTYLLLSKGAVQEQLQEENQGQRLTRVCSPGKWPLIHR